MTMEPPDDKPAQRPQVIDLEAEDIGPAPEPAPAAPPPPPPPKRRGNLWLIAALALGLLAGLLLYRGVLSNYLPSSQMTALKNQVAALETNIAAMNSDLAGVKDQAVAAADAASAARAAAGDAGKAASGAAQQAQGLAQALDDNGTRLAALEKSVAALSADLGSLRKSVSVMGTGGSAGVAPADSAALAALGQRIDVLESELFLGKDGPRTIFVLTHVRAVNIAALSAVPGEREYVVLPGTAMVVTGRCTWGVVARLISRRRAAARARWTARDHTDGATTCAAPARLRASPVVMFAVCAWM